MAALAAYRQLLRATRVAFKGDQRLLISAREQARSSFNGDRQMAAGSEEAAARIAHAEDVAKILRHNVVQGERVDGSVAGQALDEERYRIRIHEDTERGSNETVKTAGKGTKLSSNKGTKGIRMQCGGP